MGRTHLITFVILATLSQLATCQQASTNTTVAESNGERLGWMWSSSSQRSSWGIIWSCMGVFIICSWKCTHLNLPTLAESQANWYTPLAWLKHMRKLNLMFITIIAPEVVVGIAARDYAYAKEEVKHANAIIRHEEDKISTFRPQGVDKAKSTKRFTATHGFYARMGGFVIQFPDKAQIGGGTGPSYENIHSSIRLTLKDVAHLENMGISFNISKEDVKDRAKADTFTKLLAVAQAGWLVVQSIARWRAELPITQLELMTMAFTACALITYLLWLSKPLDAERPTVIRCPDEQAYRFLSIYRKSPDSRTYDYDWRPISERHPELTWLRLGSLIMGLSSKHNTSSPVYSSCALYAAGVVFSGIHLAAWSWSFPSHAIQILWRCFSATALATCLLPLLSNVAFNMWNRLHKDDGSYDDYSDATKSKDRGAPAFAYVTIITLGTGIVLNVVSRLGLVVLTFYCFVSMPAGVYTDLDWTQLIPHFS